VISRLATLRAAFGFLQVAPRAPELRRRLLHRWLDTWTGLGLIVVGVEPDRACLDSTSVANIASRRVKDSPWRPGLWCLPARSCAC